ncbi:MAG TPA: class I SAM-dependent methyltransferase [Ktedonobacterales bacterium]|jgi:SAM-dependent methyltransferase
MSTAQIQGSLWGVRARDYAETLEPFRRPLYEAVFAAAEVGVGTQLLDVGCGPGLAAQLASKRGARVAGLDAAEASLEIARVRSPEGDFRAGELEHLPWADNTFDIVTGFNAFQYAAEVVNALREARRVARPGGHVAMAVWGRAEDCETAALVTALGQFLPPPPPGSPGPFALSAPGRVEGLLELAGLSPLSNGEVACPFEFADLETAVRGSMSSGPAAAAIQQAGAEAVRQAIAESLAPFRTSEGAYRQRNTFRYVIATA